MDKAAVALVLQEMALLLELKGENPFKVRAFQNAVRILESLDADLGQLVRDKQLSTLKGIGAGLSDAITRLVTTDRLVEFDALKKAIPAGLVELTRIQGLGPKRAKLLYEKLNIQDVAALEKACKDDKIAKLTGFGPKSQENILKGISFLSQHADYHLLDEAGQAADAVMAALKKIKAIRRLSVCGSLRRAKEMVRDIDVLASIDAPSKKTDPRPAIMQAFVDLPQVERILGQGETKSSVLLAGGLQVDLRVVSDEQYPFALHYFTGSKEHNIVMRQRAQDRGFRLNEYGLFNVGKEKPKKAAKAKDGPTGANLPNPIACKEESDLFKQLGLDYIPPELREDRGEFQAAEHHQLPRLVSLGDLKGTFHVHSTWSDGKNGLEEMIAEAQTMGLSYLGISDHSKSAGYANGLSEERVRQQEKEIERLRKKYSIHIFWGTECDILKDGSMDYADEVLKRYDFVIASVHSSFTLPESEMTARIQKALRNPYVTFLGHATGRLLLTREPYAVSLGEVFKVAASEGVAVEINSLPDRLELDWRQIPIAKQFGVQFSIHPDAHSTHGLHALKWGVGIARKGWLEKTDVVNTRSLKDITTFLAR